MNRYYFNSEGMRLDIAQPSCQKGEWVKFADLKIIRRAVADYMVSEGCSCCENTEAHRKHAEALAKLLKVPMYKDKSGYNFYKFQTKRKK